MTTFEEQQQVAATSISEEVEKAADKLLFEVQKRWLFERVANGSVNGAAVDALSDHVDYHLDYDEFLHMVTMEEYDEEVENYHEEYEAWLEHGGEAWKAEPDEPVHRRYEPYRFVALKQDAFHLYGNILPYFDFGGIHIWCRDQTCDAVDDDHFDLLMEIVRLHHAEEDYPREIALTVEA